MNVSNKDLICALLKSIETGDSDAVAVVDESKYIQHNPQTHEGSEGLATLFKRLSKTSPKVNIVRAFEDADFVFAHTEYDFSNRNIGFEVFRFEGNRAVEHWDNIQPRKGPNSAGHSMVDGETQVTDIELTEKNRQFLDRFINTVLINKQFQHLDNYIDVDNYVEHNPSLDSFNALRTLLTQQTENGYNVDYRQLHRVLAQGNFVLCVSEGYINTSHTAFYDLFRISNAKVVEHWDTTEQVAPKEVWKNSNGKF
jgi:predicted SnoaL-like aldol condensation-catalyzing enzyme